MFTFDEVQIQFLIFPSFVDTLRRVHFPEVLSDYFIFVSSFAAMTDHVRGKPVEGSARVSWCFCRTDNKKTCDKKKTNRRLYL